MPKKEANTGTRMGHTSPAACAVRDDAPHPAKRPDDISRIRRRLEEAVRPLADGVLLHTIRRSLAQLSPSTTDAATGLPNHRAFREVLVQVRSECRRLNAPIAMLLVDLDGFAGFNELHTHRVGDQALRWIGDAIRRRCRPSDFVARYDWDQFAVCLPGCLEEQAHQTAERCRDEWRRGPAWLEELSASLRVSVGVSSLGAGFIEGEQMLIRLAAAALSEAKRGGGDRTIGWSRIASPHLVSKWLAGEKSSTTAGEATDADPRISLSHMESARALVAAVEAKDPFTRDHSLRVSHYAEGLARQMRFGQEDIDSLRTAAVLHDIGKIGVPDEVLRKPGPLTPAEYALVKRHPAIGVEILENASFFRAELPLILHHHEWYDGTGYPTGLAGEAIPLGARILAVADSIDAMLSPRSYKSAYSLDRVCEELLAFSGRQFDPQVARLAMEWIQATPSDFPRLECQAA